MRVGIYTHYAHCDQAYFAVRLCDLLRKLDIDFEIYSDKQPAKIGSSYDKRIITKKKMSFTDWAKTKNAIIWTHAPRSEPIAYCKRRNIKTILVPMWQDLFPPFRKALRTADFVVAMSAECHMLFKDIYKVRNCVLIPFDTGLAPVKKTKGVNSRKIKLLLPWFDRTAKCTGGQFISILKFIIEYMEEAHLTVAITPSHFSPAIVKFFLNLQKRFPGRVSILRGVPLNKRAELYAAHDLSVIPAECDNYGLCALTSITMGTPVVTSAIPPQTDFLFQDNNAALIDTKVDYDENGVIHALPEYEKFGFVLQQLIAEPRLINVMNQKTNYNLNTRQHHFERGWEELLDPPA